MAISQKLVAIGCKVPANPTPAYHYEGQMCPTSMPLIPMLSLNFFRPGMRPCQGGPQPIIRLSRLRRCVLYLNRICMLLVLLGLFILFMFLCLLLLVFHPLFYTLKHIIFMHWNTLYSFYLLAFDEDDNASNDGDDAAKGDEYASRGTGAVVAVKAPHAASEGALKDCVPKIHPHNDIEFVGFCGFGADASQRRGWHRGDGDGDSGIGFHGGDFFLRVRRRRFFSHGVLLVVDGWWTDVIRKVF